MSCMERPGLLLRILQLYHLLPPGKHCPAPNSNRADMEKPPLWTETSMRQGPSRLGPTCTLSTKHGAGYIVNSQ